MSSNHGGGGGGRAVCCSLRLQRVLVMAQQNDRMSSITVIAEEDSSETTLSLPVLNLRLNSSETTETTLSGNVTPLIATDGGPSEGTFASTSGREIRFLPRPNSTTNASKSNRSETSRRNEFLFLLTTDSSHTSRSEDDDIRVEEEEEESDEKEVAHPNPPLADRASRNLDVASKRPQQLQQSLGSLYKEIQFELRPQEADEEVEVLSRNGNESNKAAGDDEPDSTIEEPESTIEDEDEDEDDEGEATIRYGDETETDHTNTEATDETFSNSNLLSDAVLLLARVRSHEDSIGSCVDEDDDADDFECTKMFELSHSPEGGHAKVRDRPVEISPSARTGSKSASTRTDSSSTARSASHSRNESERSRARLLPGPAPGSPPSSHRHERSASKSSSIVSVSNHLADTPPVQPRRSPNTDEAQTPPHHSALRPSTKVASATYPRTEVAAAFSAINRRPSSPVFKGLTFEATKIITPSQSPLLSAAVPSSSRVQRVDGEDAPEIPAAAAAAAASSTSLAARLEEPKNLYEELLQYHRDHEDEESTEQGTAYSGSSWKQSSPASDFKHRTQHQLRHRSQSVASLQSVEDAKLPAQGPRSDSNSHHCAASPYYQELQGRRRSSPDVTEAHADAGRQPLQSRTSLSHLEADEAIARILQEELDAEQRRTDEESLRAALALQRQEEEELATRQHQAVTNNNFPPLVFPEGTSMDEQRHILEQIRQQQEEAQLLQALNMSSHGSPDVTGAMANVPSPQINAPASRIPQVAHPPRYPPPQPHAYPHRRSTSHDAHFADDFSDYGGSVRGGSVSSADNNHRLPSLGSTQSFGSVQPAATFPTSSMSDAFERQFRPRDTSLSQSQPSSQRHRLTSSSGSFRHRPAGNGHDALAPNGVNSGSSTYRTEWELSQQEALREFQQQKYQQEQSHPYRAAIQQSAPTIPSSPGTQMDLVRRGAAETARAVQIGRAHIVQCQNCQARLQAPIQYALVYCPSCGMVSPGRSYVPITSASASSNSSGYASSEQGPTSPGGSSLQGGDASSDRKSWN
jgi:ribosomal protein L37AE/L43A